MPETGLVLGFGGIKPAEIEAGVGVLAEVIEGQMRQARKLAVTRK